MLPVKTILHPTDFSEHSQYAFRLACSLARDYGARLIVAHVMSPHLYNSPEMGPLILDPVMIEQESKMRLLALKPADDHVVVDHRLCIGGAAAEIIAVAQDEKCDLIVMGTHGRSGFGRLLLGSVAEAVLRRAPCPVLTLKLPFPASDASTAPSPPEPVRD